MDRIDRIEGGTNIQYPTRNIQPMKEKRNTRGTNIQYPTRNIQPMKEKRNTKDNYIAQARQRYFLPLDIGYSLLDIGYSSF